MKIIFSAVGNGINLNFTCDPPNLSPEAVTRILAKITKEISKEISTPGGDKFSVESEPKSESEVAIRDEVFKKYVDMNTSAGRPEPEAAESARGKTFNDYMQTSGLSERRPAPSSSTVEAPNRDDHDDSADFVYRQPLLRYASLRTEGAKWELGQSAVVVEETVIRGSISASKPINPRATPFSKIPKHRLLFRKCPRCSGVCAARAEIIIEDCNACGASIPNDSLYMFQLRAKCSCCGKPFTAFGSEDITEIKCGHCESIIDVHLVKNELLGGEYY